MNVERKTAKEFNEDLAKSHERGRAGRGFVLSEVLVALEAFSIGLLMTHEKKSEQDARAVVDDVIRKALGRPKWWTAIHEEDLSFWRKMLVPFWHNLVRGFREWLRP